MRNICTTRWIIAGVAIALLLGYVTAPIAETPRPDDRLLIPDPRLETKTQIRPSRIPNAGNGLYALVPIKEGEIIGELGGRLMTEEEFLLSGGNGYIAGISECIGPKPPPFPYIDAKDHGGHTSRINFAPRQINGAATGFQNAKLVKLCDHPYVVFVATRDIAPGTELWTSYGPSYHYEGFMRLPAVRDFFCGLIGQQCKADYTYDY